MEIKYKGNKMKQLLIFVFLVLTGVSMAQTIDAPIGYTSFLNLKQYAYEANPGADSLNHNNTLIDNFAKASNDTANAIKTRVNTVINLGASGGIIDGTVTWNDLATATKANVVQVTGTQSVAGVKTFTDNMNTDDVIPNTTATYNLGSLAKEWFRIYTQSLRTHRLVIVNTADTSKKSEISYDGTQVDFGTAKVKIDTLDADNQNVSLRSKDFTPADLADTVLTMPKLTSSLYIELSGDATAGIEKILCDETVPPEFLLYITTDNNTYSILFEDGETDGNLLLAGDFTLAKGDMLVLKSSYRMNALETLHWQEVSRSNN